MSESARFLIGYVDEDQDDVMYFETLFSDYFDIISYIPDSSTEVDDIIEWVFANNLDLVIVDFNLKENHSVKFYGNCIIETLNELRYNFPMFIFTGFENDALIESDESIDDLIRYKNSAMKDYKATAKRILNKIEKYYSELNNSKMRHSELISKESLTPSEEDELLELDVFLEKSYGKKGTTPRSLKKSSYLTKLNELIDKADDIINNMDKHE